MDDKTLALLGDRTAQERLTEAGVLLPCDFCKSDSVIVDYKQVTVGYNGLDMPVKRYTYSCRCTKCHASGPVAGGRVIIGLGRIDGIKPPEWATTTKELEKAARLLCGLIPSDLCSLRFPGKDLCRNGSNGLVKWLKQPVERKQK